MSGSTSNKVVHTWLTQKQIDTEVYTWVTQKQNDTIHKWLIHNKILLKYTLSSHCTARLAAILTPAVGHWEVKDSFNNVDIPFSLAARSY